MTNTTTRRVYIYGEGSIWRVRRSDVAKLQAGEYFNTVCRLTAAALDYKTGKWSNLPKGIYQPGEGSDLESCANCVRIEHYDLVDEIPHHFNR